ncbi:MAG: hypothetical protein B6244_04405 [Candidatus Cloacimonetes bacterium 4572_55]|nr:MAG: hypothetical protein B6244_04405 [Candidatus Cloacimonetes bacterium 4572_55]
MKQIFVFFILFQILNCEIQGSNCSPSIQEHAMDSPYSDVEKLLQKTLPDSVAAVILDIYTGEILAVHQSKTALHRSFPIGSLIKPLTACAGLIRGSLDPNDLIYCYRSGYSDFNRCWYLNGHGRVDLTDAIAYSCNSYFRHAAQKLRFSEFSRFMENLGYSMPRTFTPEDEIDLMIGLNPSLKMTPLQILTYLSLFYNDGVLFDWTCEGVPFKKISMPDKIRDLIRRGMAASFRYGSGSGLQNATHQDSLFVKTGTAPYRLGGVEDHTKTHAWTVVFYPGDTPRIGIVIFVTQGVGSKQGIYWAGQTLRILEGRIW